MRSMNIIKVIKIHFVVFSCLSMLYMKFFNETANISCRMWHCFWTKQCHILASWITGKIQHFTKINFYYIGYRGRYFPTSTMSFSVWSKKLGPKFWTLSKMLRLCSYLVCENNSSKGFITPNMSKIGAFLTKSQNFGPRSKNLKNAPILLIFGVMNSVLESFSHTKYEQNRSIFDNVQIFGPNFFEDTEKDPSKFLICCSK